MKASPVSIRFQNSLALANSGPGSPFTLSPTRLPRPARPPSRPQGSQFARSAWLLKLSGERAWTTYSMPSPPRWRPAPAGIGDQGVALDDDGVVDLHQLGRAVMGVAVVEADRRRHPVLVVLGPPATAGGADGSDEQGVGTRVDAVHPPHHQVGVMAGRDAVGDRRRQRLEHRVHDGHREGHPAPHRRRALGADDPPGRNDRLKRAEAAVVDRVVGRRCDALEGDLGAGIGGGDA